MTTEDHTTVTLERTGIHSYAVRNGRGSEFQVGLAGAAAAFSPLELLQAALAGCAALSGDTQFATKLGKDFDAVVTVDAELDPTADRLTSITATLTPDMSSLDSQQAEKLAAQADRVIERLCAVKRTLNAGLTARAVITQ